jgi:hypothetical protein
MKNIKYFLIFLALLIVAVIALNYINSKPNKAKENPYEYNVDEFKEVDPALIHYKEVRQIKVHLADYSALTSYNGNIYLAANMDLSVLSPLGERISQFTIKPDARALAVDENNIVIAFKEFIEVYTHQGELNYTIEQFSDSSVYTSITIWNEKIVVADAGKRRLYGFKGTDKVMEIEGVSGAKNLHGFIIPSAYFEVAVNAENELWSTNPGMHSLQHYNESGDLLAEWDKISMEIEGFTGCCNPAQFTFLPDGRFLTSEKGMPRIKIYSQTGELESVVAAPYKFEGNQHAAEVAVINETIFALDFDRKMIRVFEKINP